MWKEFCKNITVPGMEKVTNNNYHVLRRLMWLILILGGTCFLCYHLLHRIQYYFATPVMVSMSVEYKTEMDFPAVTLCNRNAITKTNISQMNKEEAALTERLLGLKSYHEIDYDQLNFTRFNWSEFVSKQAHRIEDMFLMGWWEQKPITSVNFTSRNSDVVGKCYTFNYKTKLKAAMTGINNGLLLFLNIESEKYHSALVFEMAFRVIIHSPDDVPIVAQHSFTISPGIVTSIALKRVRTKNLPAPTGRCGDRPLRFFSSYTFNRCLLECHTNYTERICYCKFVYMPGTAPICSLDKYDDICLGGFQDNYAQEITKCSCPIDCTQDNYEKTTSIAQLNPHLLKALNFLKPNTTTPEDYLQYLQNNMAVVNIHYEELRDTVVEHKEAYTWLALLSDIGGAFGLILGGCLLTVAEIADFLLASFFTNVKKVPGLKRLDVALMRRHQNCNHVDPTLTSDLADYTTEPLRMFLEKKSPTKRSHMPWTRREKKSTKCFRKSKTQKQPYKLNAKKLNSASCVGHEGNSHAVDQQVEPMTSDSGLLPPYDDGIEMDYPGTLV